MYNLEAFINNRVRLKNFFTSDQLTAYKHTDGKPNFSVIIPCYNTGETIERTVASVMGQTLTNLEIIIVNDASTDQQTLEKLKELEEYVTVIHLENNGGLSNARNVGIDKTSADHILCLDSDDFIASTYLEKAKQLFDQDTTVGVVGTGVQNFGGSSGSWRQPENFQLEELLAANTVVVASCVRRSVYDDVGLYDVKLRSYEDWEFWIRVFSSTRKWNNRVIQDNLFYYCVQSDSMQHSMDHEAMSKVLGIIFEKHEKLYKKHFKNVFQNIHILYTDKRLANKTLAYKVRQKDDEIFRLVNSKTVRAAKLFHRSRKNPLQLISFPYLFMKIVLGKESGSP